MIVPKALVLLVIILIIGCDSMHTAHVRIAPSALSSTVAIEPKNLDSAVPEAVREFANKIGFKCNEPGQNGESISCGPYWHRKIVLYDEGEMFRVTYFEGHPGWGGSPYFCSVQAQMFEYFANRFRGQNLELKTNDVCKRDNYP